MAIERPPRNIRPSQREAILERWEKLTAAFDRELENKQMSGHDRERLLRELQEPPPK